MAEERTTDAILNLAPAPEGEGEGEPGAPGGEPGAPEIMLEVEPSAPKKPVAEQGVTEKGEEPILMDDSGTKREPVPLPVPEPRIVNLPTPTARPKSKSHKLQRDIKVFSAPSDFDENPPPKVLDMCLIMDCTGSMSAWIKHCKDTLRDVIDDSMEEDEGSVVRVAFVGYRDFCDKQLYDIHDFTYLDQDMKRFISKRKAKGGGDAPEDIQGGLHQALQLSWREESMKVCFLVADAPCHGKKYHRQNDDYPAGSPNGLVLEDLVKQFSDREILLTCYKLTNDTEQMYEIMERAYNEGAEEDGFEFIDIRGQVQGSKALTHMELRPEPVYRGAPAPSMASSSEMRSRSRMECEEEDCEDEAPYFSMPSSVMRSAPRPERSMASNGSRSEKINLKSTEMRDCYKESTRNNLRKQKGKMRKRKGW